MVAFHGIKTRISHWLILLMCLGAWSCGNKPSEKNVPSDDPYRNVLVKRRADGTLSSVNQLDEAGIVHGLRVTYYQDGKTIYSRITLQHGMKQGPSVRYYKNGQVFEYLGYRDGKKHGPVRKYYKNGRLMAEFEYRDGIILQGLKEYQADGTLVTGYPEIQFTVEDHLKTLNRIDLRIRSTPVRQGIRYYLKQRNEGHESRIYLISENGSAVVRRYVKPGSTLQETIEIIAECPTELGNVMVREVSYDLKAGHPDPGPESFGSAD